MDRYARHNHVWAVTATYTPVWKVWVAFNTLVVATVVLNWCGVG